MSGVLNFTEIDSQNAELLPARILMSTIFRSQEESGSTSSQESKGSLSPGTIIKDYKDTVECLNEGMKTLTQCGDTVGGVNFQQQSSLF
jgi:hypothetical protein